MRAVQLLLMGGFFLYFAAHGFRHLLYASPYAKSKNEFRWRNSEGVTVTEKNITGDVF